MKCKKAQDELDYQNIGLMPSEENSMLRNFVDILQSISILTGHDPLVITSYIRKGNKKSLHYYARALDIRVRDKSKAWYFAMISIGAAFGMLNPQFRMNPHLELYGKPEQHIHVEIRSKKE